MLPEPGSFIFLICVGEYKMEPGPMAAAAAATGAYGRGLSTRAPCRNFIRGACRWGQSCRFSHDRKSSQICRFFQNGFCGYGDRCSFQHISLSEGQCGSRRSSDPVVFVPGGSLLPYRRGSEPSTFLEPAALQNPGSRCGSEPAIPSMAQLRRSFERLSTEFEDDEGGDSSRSSSEHWAQAAEFVPRRPLLARSFGSQEPGLVRSTSEPALQECEEYRETGIGLIEASSKESLADNAVLNEGKEAGREGASAFEQSKDVICGICMDKVYDKLLPEERLFGILPNCSHAYCINCIRQWRKSRDFQNEVIKSCPLCRIKSSYFIPHTYWITNAEEKTQLIETFKARTSKIRCRFFMRGNGYCPFKSDCIYLHELPAGQHPRRRRERRTSAASALSRLSAELMELEEDLYLFHHALAILESDLEHQDHPAEVEILLECSDLD
ncbi:probable E3 ubiquitin-protein ligase makorin-1 [Rhinatrema bivittatum]|uniref:probable E3 ubiquitin-protein ligase makorin-1 n=1 Tax=Rhinatrema bivittatum TaxID=194408 RepID=UPI00112997ED|nr:probable E3 ubiquitin-protein ligase makorin-1 [Rhinatrema bivittatum]